MADQAAVEADPVAAAQAFAARAEADRVEIDQMVARARVREASAQAALASVRSIPSGTEGAAQIDEVADSDVAAPSCLDDGLGTPGTSEQEVPPDTDQDLIDLGTPEEDLLG